MSARNRYDQYKKKVSDSSISARDRYNKYKSSIDKTKVDLTAQEKKAGGWFQSGLFEDGYDFGDITRTILGTATDVTENVFESGIGLLESVVDTAAYGVGMVGGLFSEDFQDDVGDFISKDLLHAKEVSEMITRGVTPYGLVNKLVNDDAENASVLGDKSDQLVQSGAQLAAQIGLQAVGVPWWVTAGISSFGSEVESALGQGATFGEAGISGAITTGAELLTEKISGGIKFGGKALDDAVTDKLAKGISNKVVKSLLKFGWDATGEGAEEVLSGAISAIGQKITYADDKELNELFSFEDAFDSFIGGAVLGGGNSAIASVKNSRGGRDPLTALTANEQKVLDSVVAERVAEAEKDGKKLTTKEKNEIYDRVQEELKKGYISTDTIEKVLGGDTYRSYQETVSSEDAILKEFEELGNKTNPTLKEQARYAELQAKVKEIENNSNRSSLKTQLSEEVKKQLTRDVKGKTQTDNYLLESYNEKARRGQVFEADVSKYSKNQAAVIQKAIDSGILNNTNRTHEFVDMIAKISADKGVIFDFANNEKIKNSGFAVEGKTVNGYVTKDGITLNIQSSKALNTVVGHEITHVLEGTELYSALQEVVTEYAKTKGEYDSRYKALENLYKNVEGADINAELTADLVGDYLFTDKNFINELSAKHRNIFQKIYDEIKYLCKIATAGSKEARELEKVKRAFDKAYKENVKAKENTAEGGAKYSLSDNAETELHKALYDTKYRSEVRLREVSPSIMTSQKGVKNLPMVMNASHIRENVFTEEEAKSLGLRVDKHTHYHGLGEELFLQVVDGLDNVKEAYRGTSNATDPTRRENYFLLISEFKDKNGNTINVPVYINEHAQYNRVFIDVNKISTVFGRENFNDYINKQLKEKNLVRIKNRSTQISERNALIAMGYEKNASANSISQNSEKSTGNQKNSLSAENSDIGPIGNYNISGKDIEFFAPTKEDLDAMRQETASAVENLGPIGANTSEQSDIAPRSKNAADAKFSLSEADNIGPVKSEKEFPENFAPTAEDLAPAAQDLGPRAEDAGIGQISESIDDQNSIRYNLDGYSKHQKENWKNSKRIVLCEGIEHFRQFIRNALSGNTQTNKKMYFGTISSKLAEDIENATGANVKGYNLSLAEGEIRKINKSHGDEKTEAQRGQRAITEDDYLNIPQIVQSPDSITLSPKLYEGKPVVEFRKTNGNETSTVAAVISDKRLDLFVQTTFINKKSGDIATPKSVQADSFTPKATGGTAPVDTSNVSTDSISQNAPNVNMNSQNSSDIQDIDPVKSEKEFPENFAPTAEDLAPAAQDLGPRAEDISNIKTVKDRLKAKLTAIQTELDNNITLREETRFNFDLEIERLQAEYDSKKQKNTKTANNLIRRIERLKRFRDSEDANYAKRINDIESRISNINAELQKDHTKADNLEREYARIDKRLEQDKLALTKEFEEKRATIESQLKDKNGYISNRATELYNEISNLKKGIRASQELGYLLDHGFSWSTIKSKLLTVKHSPTDTVNPDSVEESTIREMLDEEYNNKLYDIEEEYQQKLSQLEQRAEKERDEARKADQRIKISELHQNLVDGIKSKFTEKGLDFDEVLKKAKDLSTLSTVDNTPQRVMEKALGYENGQILADATVNKVAQNETEGIKWLNSFTDRKNGLLANISKQYKIKPGSKESAAAQMYAEGFYVNDNDELIKYGDEELAKDFPDEETQKNIKGLANDPRIRQIYDETLEAINESRRRNAYPEIQRLENYFLHFRAMEDTFSRLGLPFNPKDIKAKDLPTDLNGVTANLKPGQPYFASAKHRTGKRTSFDLLGGLERYLSSAKNQIYHIDDIQTLRALRNYIADTYGQANGLEGLDSLSEEEAQEKIKQVYNSHLSTFAKFLNEEANIIAGKTALIDRGLEGIIGRRGIAFLDTVNKQVGSNMVGFNVSSSLTNFVSGVQAIAKTNKFSCVKAFAQTAKNKVCSLFGKTDSFVENNPTIIRRKGAESFYRTPFQKVGDAGYVLMSAVDNVTTEFIVRAKYNEFIKKGMSEQEAVVEADKWTSRLMGDRSLGQMPQLYNSKMLGLVTKFQLEVRNQLDSQFYDTIKEAQASTKDIQSGLKRNAKTAAMVTAAFFELAVLQHLFGMAFEAVAGYNPTFDIIEVLIKTLGFDDEEDSKDTVLDNIEEGFLTLLEDLPYTSTFTGGRIPISSALPVKEFIKGEDEYGNEKSRWTTIFETIPYYLLPTGYGQAKKTVKGLSMFDDDNLVSGSYTDSGNLRFPVENTPGNIAQAALFGQWANKNAKDYFENERTPLAEKQIREYVAVDIPIAEYWKYRDGLKDLKTLEEKLDYIDSLDLPLEKKNILANNVADRKEPLNMQNYGSYGSYEEFDFAEQSPEKYAVVKAIGGYKAYKRYSGELYKLKADKDRNGNAISGSRKKKVIEYINGLDADYGEKIILFRSEYKSDDTYNRDILEYLNSREDISYDEMVAILTELGFKVGSDGKTVRW